MNVIADAIVPRWTRKPKARPEEVLEAALDLFARDGFAATRMDDIAKAAGLSKAAIYLYFPSKDDVFKALVETRIVKMRMQIAEAAQALQSDPIAGLKEVMRLWAASNADGRMIALPRIVLAESARFPELADYYHRVVISQTQSVLISLLETGVAQGVFRAMDIKAAARAFVAPLMFEMLRRQAFHGDALEMPLTALSETFFDLFLNGISVIPEQGPTS
jgi:AcrR family transcriptional regulator